MTQRASQGEWIIDCRPNGYKGKRERVPFTGTEGQARAWERRMMRRHIDISTPTARSQPGIYPLWKASYRIERAARTVEDAWKHLKKLFGKLQPKVITRQLIERYQKTRLSDGVKPRTINQELSYLSVMLKWAAQNNYCYPMPFNIAKFPKKMAAAPKPRPESISTSTPSSFEGVNNSPTLWAQAKGLLVSV